MKRYNIYCFGAVPDEVDEAPDGDWVRYEDADALQRQCQALVADAAEFTCEVVADLTEARDQAQAAAKASHAELEELRARVTRAVGILATPGTWSEFAQRALKELRG